MKLPFRLRRILDSWATEGRPWMGYLLLASILLAVLGFLVLVATGLIILGTVGGRESADYAKGVPMALIWLFCMLSVVPVSAFYMWWHFSRGSRPRGIHVDLAAAQGGDALAAHRLGLHYRQRDPGSARAWLAQAARGGVAEAMVELALDLREGRGGPRDLVSARGWLQRATLAGEPRAAALLAEVEAQMGDRHSERGI